MTKVIFAPWLYGEPDVKLLHIVVYSNVLTIGSCYVCVGLIRKKAVKSTALRVLGGQFQAKKLGPPLCLRTA